MIDAAAPIDEAGPPGAAPASGIGATAMGDGRVMLELPYGMRYEITPQGIREWIDTPFHAAAVQCKEPALELTTFDRELWTPAVTGCLNAWLPELFKRVKSPHVAALIFAAVVYAARVLVTVYGPKIGGMLLDKLLRMLGITLEKDLTAQVPPDTSERATWMGGSPASSPSSASPEPVKPSSPPDSSRVAGIRLPLPSE